jgi:hypothetical protein
MAAMHLEHAAEETVQRVQGEAEVAAVKVENRARSLRRRLFRR